MKPGDELPPLEIEVTRTLIVAGALASRDYQDVHHDPEAARAKGSPDVFMNILTTNGLVGRYITDLFGPGTVLHKVAIRLGAPNYPGDTMVLRGTVEDLRDPDLIVVRITGDNGIGRHVSGTVTATIPGWRATDPTSGIGTVTVTIPEGPDGPDGPDGPEASETSEAPDGLVGPEGAGR